MLNLTNLTTHRIDQPTRMNKEIVKKRTKISAIAVPLRYQSSDNFDKIVKSMKAIAGTIIRTPIRK